MEKRTKVVIIGAGPSGLTAAIYLNRAGYDPYIIESYMPGGKMALTYTIENYPGFKNVNGSDLAYKMLKQVEHLGMKIYYETVNSIEKIDGLIKIISSRNEIICDAVIIATGTKEKKLNIPNEDKFMYKGISFCAVCDGGLYRNQPMAIIGGGNSSLEEALYLKDLASPLYLIHRRKEFRGDLTLVEKVKKEENIKILTPYIPIRFDGNEKLEKLIIENVETKEQKELDISGCFEYVGLDANTSFVKNKEILDENGYILTNEMMETSIEGIYAIGDVRKKKLRQIVTATSDGAISSMAVVSYLKNK